jgi:SpoVK/Ycf46/Vps4 family AAA+-type ATPase
MNKNLYEMLDMCDEACDAITNLNVGSVTAFSTPLKEIMHTELLQFTAYISLADGNVSDEEYAIIQKALKLNNYTKEQLKRAVDSIRFSDNYTTTLPVAFKYFVLADAGRKIPNDRNGYQNAQLLYDVYKLLGQRIIAAHSDNHDRETRRLTDYTRMLELFLKEYGVFYFGTRKKFNPVDDENGRKINMDNLRQAAVGKNEATKAPEKEINVDELLSELNSYVGLNSVKKEVESLVNLIKVQKMRENMGLKGADVSKHMVFLGNPGTGKTTVARLLSKIYQGLGVLRSDNYVEVDRSGLVSGYVGQTATKTAEVIEEAMGGILFIDEAYSLTVAKGENDFGQEAVDTLLKAMEDHRDDLVVIVAGYQKPMEEFLSSNPGLKSRFNKFLYFENYTKEELVQIMESMCASRQYELSEEARRTALEYFERKTNETDENFANAREVRNYLEAAITRHATRVIKIEKPDRKLLVTLEKEDLSDNEDLVN